MTARRFWLFSLCVLVLLAILIALGSWQLQRLEWKQKLIAQITAGMTAPTQSLPDEIYNVPEFRHFEARGVFLHELERHIYRPAPNGGAAYHIMTPFKRSNGSYIFVNRGWVPERLKDPETRCAGQVEGEIVVRGVLRNPQIPARWGINRVGDADVNVFHLFWPVELGLTVDLDMPAYYLAADDQMNPGGWPQGGVTRVNLPNNHLQYALTWYGLALTLIGVYAVVAYRRRRAVS